MKLLSHLSSPSNGDHHTGESCRFFFRILACEMGALVDCKENFKFDQNQQGGGGIEGQRQL
ncbi:hypothetical protein [Paenibacillus cucumis (ex Kampfer et al. 2016)]|uniref:Uncharacterized protein n=1 Tax=Paenibacillus cucumis (ex Kampfer et al. 2016) TaxID=1776858 RepID=A0ABS7KHS6_9BACL|nr:hypothetical protein [Paenibacillus cucumis (ex Kampfer et al. 2016)]MBY0203698.1 hypothetical protein [Paenibacillus cucumis (ex Kampfer et al. 2016)]